jgi:hypothetical protein
MWHSFIQSFTEVRTEIRNRKQREIDEEKKIKELDSIPRAKARQSVNIPNNVDLRNLSETGHGKRFT